MIANIERSANLFVTKTVYAILIAVFVAIAGWQYPFLPRHLTIVSTFTIGIPGFFLALAPNKRRYVPGFLERVLRFTVPAGAVGRGRRTHRVRARVLRRRRRRCGSRARAPPSCCAPSASGCWSAWPGPFNWWRTLLVAAMAGSIAVILAVPWLRDFYALRIPSGSVLAEMVAICLFAVVGIETVWQVTRRSIERRNPEYAAAAAHID